jgi:hypothetical protein
MKAIHWRTDLMEPSTPVAKMLDMPLRDIVMLSKEEALTQNTCVKLE